MGDPRVTDRALSAGEACPYSGACQGWLRNWHGQARAGPYLKLRNLSRCGRRRGRGDPDPLPGLRHSIAVKDVLAVRVDHLALDGRQLDRGLLIDHRSVPARDIAPTSGG